jgi:monofunctional glycosyltransferase
MANYKYNPRKKRRFLIRIWLFFKKPIITLLRVCVYSALIFALLSVLWVMIYRVIDPPFTFIMARDFLQGKDVHHSSPSLADMGRNIQYAVIAAEDAKFCSHYGFDFEAINKALNHNNKGKKLRGGSTISQQVAKNVFLWPYRSWVRKGFETWFTMLIEAMWPKKRIMEVYLGVAEWGNGIYGAQEAAKHHFGRSATNLTRTQAARLASILPSPKKWSAANPGPFMTRKSNRVRRSMNDVESNFAKCLD